MRTNNSPEGRREAGGVVSLVILSLFATAIGLLLLADVWYLLEKSTSLRQVWQLFLSADVQGSLRLSIVTSSLTLFIVLMTAIPCGYALARRRFPGHTLLNTAVDIPIVLPPVVLGLSLLAVFGSPIGYRVKLLLRQCGIELTGVFGIVMCQYLVSVSYCIRAMKSSFEGVDRDMEDVALSLGCTPAQTFFRVTLPLTRNGLLAGAITAWARAIGVFGPLMVFTGTSRRVAVMPTTMWLELNTGNTEAAFIIALLTLVIAGVAIAFVHLLVPGKNWA